MPASGPTVLLVESQPLIVLALSVELEDLGMNVVGPLTSCAEATAWLAQNNPAVAVLNTALRDGPCHDVARDLKARGIPFLFYAGRSRRQDLPGDLRDATWVDKPALPIELLQAVVGLLPKVK